ncbi:hypothetical protein GGI42DRAFT_363358 [Trichoderma sp. SZMC 28013]
MDTKIHNFENPPRLTFSELNIKTTDPKWIEAFRCVKMYHQQAMDLLEEDAQKMIAIIMEGDYKVTGSARTSPASHKIYRIPEDHQTHILDIEKVEWIHYLILKAIYPTREIPDTYMNLVKKKFGMVGILDMSESYYEVYPDIGEEMRKLESTTESGHEQDDDGQDTLVTNQDQRQKLIDLLTREDLIKMGSDRKVTKNGVALLLTEMEFRNAAVRTAPPSKRPVGTAPPKPSIEKAQQAPAKASLAIPVSSAKKPKSATKKRSQDDFLDQTATELNVEENTQSSPTPVEDFMISTPSRSSYVDSTLSNKQRTKRLKKSKKETSGVGHEKETTVVGREKETEESSMQLATPSEANQRVILQKLEALEQRIKAMEQRIKAMEQKNEATEQRVEAIDNREKTNTKEHREVILKMSEVIEEIRAEL